jgi:lipid-binding SYLF domain-containing protein
VFGTRRHGWRPAVSATVAALVLALSVLAASPPARADDAGDTRELTERAVYTIQRFQDDSAMEGFRELMRERARAILILPQVIKVGFIAGGSGGSGVLMARSAQGDWIGPAFYTMYQFNIGLLAGAEATEMVIMALTEKGLTSLLSTTMKWGAEASGAVGPVGMGAAAASAGLSADLVVYSRGKGLYGGFSLDGAVLDIRETLNGAYYGRSVTPMDILIRGEAKNPHAQPLADLLKKIAAAK